MMDLESEVRLLIINSALPRDCGFQVVCVRGLYAVKYKHRCRQNYFAYIFFRRPLCSSADLWTYLSQLRYIQGQIVTPDERRQLETSRVLPSCRECSNPVASCCTYYPPIRDTVCLRCWYHY